MCFTWLYNAQWYTLWYYDFLLLNHSVYNFTGLLCIIILTWHNVSILHFCNVCTYFTFCIQFIELYLLGFVVDKVYFIIIHCNLLVFISWWCNSITLHHNALSLHLVYRLFYMDCWLADFDRSSLSSMDSLLKFLWHFSKYLWLFYHFSVSSGGKVMFIFPEV